MIKLRIQNYEEKRGCYVQNGKEVTNFTLGVMKIITEGGSSAEYKFYVYTYEQTYTVTIPLGQLNEKKFLRALPVFIEDEGNFYRQLRTAVLRKEFSEDEILYRTDRNGLQKVKGQWIYVYTNGSIDKSGFRKDIYSGVEGAYIPESAVVEPKKGKEAVDKLFYIYNSNCEIYYPLFFMNLMAITNGYFNMLGEPYFMKLTLWLDGPSGIGKTSLIREAGTYTFRDEQLNKEFVSATGRRRHALECLERSSGMVCILDDVKQENVRERKNSIKNIVDDFIRSVFQGRMTDAAKVNSKPKEVDTCAIINGEYMDTKESQNARMLCLRMKEFIGDRRNLDGINELQKNPLWLTVVCIGYIRWILTMMEESSFPEMLNGKLRELRNSQGRYAGISNAVRLNENQHMMEMAQMLAGMYFCRIGMTEEFMERFVSNARLSIRALCDSTFELLGGEQAVLAEALERVFSKCKIRKACFVECNLIRNRECRYLQEYFWIDRNEGFVWIESYRKSLLKTNHNGDEQYDESPYLIIREKLLLNLLEHEIKNLLKEGKAVSAVADKVLCNLTKNLKKFQIIYRQYRADDKWGRTAIGYPVYQCWNETREYYNSYTEEDEDEEIRICEVEYEPVIQMNTCHPYIKSLIKRMDSEETETILENVWEWEERSIDKEEIYKIRKSFTNNKSLYKE